MHRSIIRFVLFALAALLFMTTLTAVAQDTKKQPSPEEMQKMMEAWQKVATPGPQHATIAEMAGNWNFHMVMTGMGDKPMESDGTAKCEMIFDGRFLTMNADGMMMGMPWKGTGLLGFDNFKSEYQMTWADNMGTMIATSHGKPGADAKVITLTGKMDEPATGEKDKDTKFVWRIVDKDHLVLEGYDQVGTPKEFKAMEVSYTRTK